MPAILTYGDSSTLELHVEPTALVANCGPHGEPVPDPAAAVLAELEQPLGYPPLALATVPGDHVALVLDEDLPQLPRLVAGAVQSLVAGGVEPENISVLRGPAAARPGAVDAREALAPELAESIRWITHDPTDPSSVCFLGTAESGESVYLNRAIYDADLVLPIVGVRLRTAFDYRGMFASLYPVFSNEKTIERFRAPLGRHGLEQRKARRRESDEAAWLLGIRLIVQVVPGNGSQILHVLAGDIDAVGPRGKELCAAAWSCSVPGRARLVVASVAGGPSEQTWDNVARALVAADRVVTDDGVVAVCTDLTAEPGPSIMRLASAKDLRAAQHEIHHDRTADAPAAAQVARALGRGTVYLLSRLDEELVEQLGLAPVSNAGDVARLARRFESCILLGNAQRTVPTVKGE